MRYTVYSLKDPDTSEILYIGVTSKSLIERLIGHISERKDCAKNKWIKKLISEGKVPLITAIEENIENGYEREGYWIKYYQEKGLHLFNMPVGGFRENAKRPLKYGEPTEMIPFRIPKSRKKEFKEITATWLKEWEVNK
ncbi:MAG TPA: GIY-YIG nuclease family protein [Chitinophagaceae bacterium]|nr:GIY-YIG nuclease family protein [Chitinophagaceae bacterium]